MKTQDYHLRILALGDTLSPACKVTVLVIDQYAKSSGYCFLSQRHLATKVGLSLNALKGALHSLERAGYLRRTPASSIQEIGKNRGWAWSVAWPSEGSDVDPSPADQWGQPLTPPSVNGQSLTPCEGIKNTFHNNNINTRGQDLTGQILTPSRSTTTSTLRDGSVGGGSSSRVSEATGDLPTASKPKKSRKARAGGEGVAMVADATSPSTAFMDRATPRRDLTEDETDRNALRAAIIEALPELNAEALKAAMIQNRAHLQMILDAFKLDVEAASSWAADKAQDLYARMPRLREPAVSKLLADDAEMDAARWMSGSLKPRAVQQAALSIEAPQVVEREPEQLGEVVTQALSGVRRAPQAAPQERPDWWWGLVGELTRSSALADAGIDSDQEIKTTLLLVKMVLGAARVEVRGGVAWVSAGLIVPTEIETVAKHAKTWGRVLSVQARKLGLVERVQWAEGAPDEAAQLAEVVKAEPKAAPMVHGPRPASPRPVWWDSLGQQLGLWATRHQQMPDKATTAASVRQLIPVLAKARRAWLEGEQLTIELESLGALRAVWPLLEPVVGWAVQLYADLPRVPRVVVVELAGAEVRP